MRKDYLKQLICFILLGWAMFILGRIVFAACFVPWTEIWGQKEFWGIALWNAFRFDMQTLAYVVALPSLVCIGASNIKSFKFQVSSYTWVTTFLRWYYCIVYTILSALIVGDICFYKNFHDHYNVTTFDFFNEEPLTLIQTFWEEYPVVWIVLAVGLVGIVVYKVPGSKAEHKFSGLQACGLAVLWIALVVVAMRGSVTEFPLQVEDMYVAPSETFNACVPNATYCLKKAWQEKNTAFEIGNEEGLLRDYGFKTVDEAWQALGKSDRSLFSVQGSKLESSLQPDIVLVLSESWSGYLVKYGLETKDDKLLCGMRKHLESDILFQNYQSVQNGTIATIENLLISTPFPRVFTSKYQYLKFPTSFAKPFQESGYEVTFLSGMDEGWENIGSGLNTLGIKKMFKYELLKKHPEYKFNSVGIYDHYVMNSLYEMLKDQDLNKSRGAQKVSGRRPQLIIVMTTTNHPPFVYPDDVKLPDMGSGFYDKPFLANSRDVGESYIKGFQYANYSMALFLDKLKSSYMKDNTIVMMTGDHNVRTALKYADDGKCAPKSWEHRVPMYMFLPERFRAHETLKPTKSQKPSTWGCHYDIVTTLAPFAFKKGVRYLDVGQNLLSDTLTEKNSYSYNVECLLCDKQNKDAARKANARELLLRLYFKELLK